MLNRLSNAFRFVFFGADADQLMLNDLERNIKEIETMRVVSEDQIRKWQIDSLALELVKRRLREKPPRRRQISITEINQIEDSVNGKGRDQA